MILGKAFVINPNFSSGPLSGAFGEQANPFGSHIMVLSLKISLLILIKIYCSPSAWSQHPTLIQLKSCPVKNEI